MKDPVIDDYRHLCKYRHIYSDQEYCLTCYAASDSTGCPRVQQAFERAQLENNIIPKEYSTHMIH